MKYSIFEFSSYKSYLIAIIRHNPHYGHGFRSKLAKTLGCQAAYISQVLNKEANFSLEQAEDVNELLQHSKEEGYFFRLLVQLERAGSVKLKSVYKQEIAEILSTRELLKERVEKTESLTKEQQTRYYSRWYYSAIHILCTIPEYQTKDAIIKNLKLDVTTVNEAIDFLTESGLLVANAGRYTTSTKRLFLGNDSVMISQLHSNWRLKAIDSLDRRSDRDLHFSTCISLAESDFRKIKNRLIEEINQVRSVVKESKEEDLCCFNVDFFSLLHK